MFPDTGGGGDTAAGDAGWGGGEAGGEAGVGDGGVDTEGAGGRGRYYPDEPYPPPVRYDDEYDSIPYYGPPVREPEPEEETKYLEGVVEHLEKEMAAVKKRIGELVKGKKEEKK